MLLWSADQTENIDAIFGSMQFTISLSHPEIGALKIRLTLVAVGSAKNSRVAWKNTMVVASNPIKNNAVQMDFIMR